MGSKKKDRGYETKDADAVKALNDYQQAYAYHHRQKEKGKELDDADVLSALQKAEKELLEEKPLSRKLEGPKRSPLWTSNETVRKYLPKLLSAEEIKEIIASLEDKSVPR